MKKFLISLFPAVLLTALALGFMRIPEPLEAFRLKYFDLLMQWKPRDYSPLPVKIADIDDETLSRYGQWPWPRTLVAKLLDRLREEKASVAAFDILFPEPDRTSPSSLIALWSQQGTSPELEKALLGLPDPDTVLAESMKQMKTVTAFSLSDTAGGGNPAAKSGFSFAGSDPTLFLPDFPGAVTTLSELEKQAAGNGIITYFAEYDGAVRSVPLVFQLRGSLYPSLLLEAFRLYQGARSYVIKTSDAGVKTQFGAEPGIEQVRAGKNTIPTDRLGRMRLYDSGFAPDRFVPVWKILEGSLTPGSLEGAIVFIGTSAAGLKDIRITPLNPAAAGVEVHAQLAEQILSQVYLIRPDWAEGAEFCFFLFTGLFLIFFLPRLGALWAAMLTGTSIIGFYGFSFYAFKTHLWLVDPVLPSLAALVIYIAASLIHYLRTDAEKRQIRGAFSRYLAPAVVEELARHPEKLKLGGEMKNMSVLFADIRGFTSLAEKMKPEELTRFLNQFLTPMTEIILRYGGTIDKYMGDGIMAFWNAPVEDPAHAARSCRAALEMQAALKNRQSDSVPIQMGIGINTGVCCVGNLGSDQRFDYSVIGDSVNLASRLEGLSKTVGAGILIGPETRDALGSDFFSLEAGLIQVKGKEKPVRVYALAGEAGLVKAETKQAWEETHAKMIHLFLQRKWENALEEISSCRKYRWPDKDLNPLYDFFEKQIRDYQIHEPPKDWSGTWISRNK